MNLLEDKKESSNETIISIVNYQINRNILTQDDVNKETNYNRYYINYKESIKNYFKTLNFVKWLKDLIPILDWLPKYPVKKNLVNDIVSGLTVAVLQIPQAMAYALLAGLQPEIGLYMAFFPVLAYLIFGTSRHISIGTFAVVALMTNDTIIKHSKGKKKSKVHSNVNVTKYFNNFGIVQSQTIKVSEDFEESQYTAIEIITALSIATSIIQFIMALLKVGRLSTFLTDPLVKGFTTAVAFHIVASQLDLLFGLHMHDNTVTRFKIISTILDLTAQIVETNIATLIVSIIVIIFSIIMKEIVKPYCLQFCTYTIPSELMIVFSSVLVSRYTTIFKDFQIDELGHIPTGLPKPNFPPLALVNKLWLEATEIAILIFSILISMGLLFAKNHAYEIKPNQELYALGFSNLIGGIFSCMPSSCSISRSLLQEQSGGETQLASFFAAMVNLSVIYLIGPVFETLPKCVLSGIILVSLKTMFWQFKEVKTYAKQGRLELAMWSTTFFTVIIFDYILGLVVGIITAIVVFLLKSVKPYYSLMGTLTVPNTGLYVCLDKHKNAVEVPGVKIFYYAGPINFATRHHFKKCFFNSIKLDSVKIQKNIRKYPNASIISTPEFRTIILNLSSVAHVDVASCHVFTEISKELELIGVKFLIASPTDIVYDTLIHSMALGDGPFVILPTVHDAVLLGKSYNYKT